MIVLTSCWKRPPKMDPMEVEMCPSPAEAGAMLELERDDLARHYLRRVLPVLCPSKFSGA